MKLGVGLKKKAAKNLQVSRETCHPLIFVLLRSSLFLLSDYLGPKQRKCRAVGGGGGGSGGALGVAAKLRQHSRCCFPRITSRSHFLILLPRIQRERLSLPLSLPSLSLSTPPESRGREAVGGGGVLVG